MSKILALAPEAWEAEILAPWFSAEVQRLHELNHQIAVVKLDSSPKLSVARKINVHSIRGGLFGFTQLLRIVTKERPDFLYIPLLDKKSLTQENLFLSGLEGLAEALQFKIVIGQSSFKRAHRNQKRAIVFNTFISDEIRSEDAFIEVASPNIALAPKRSASDWLIVNRPNDVLWNLLLDQFMEERTKDSKIYLIQSSRNWSGLDVRNFIANHLQTRKSIPLVFIDEFSLSKVVEAMTQSKKVVFDPRSGHLHSFEQIIVSWALKLKKQIYPDHISLQNEYVVDRKYHDAFSN